MKDFLRRSLDTIKENKVLTFLFVFSTVFFLYQHYTNLSWDFTVYVSNAKYWAGESQFYETQRAPLMPFMILLLSIFGWTAAEYLYIVLVSVLFLYSTIRLSKAIKMDGSLLYVSLLTPYVIFFGLINGTELLSLALIELFLALLLEKKSYAGLVLGIACLARYNYMIFLPLLIFQFDIKKLLANTVLFALPFLPWFAYNFYRTGNMFTYIADSYALNVVFWKPIAFNWFNVIYSVNILLPFFILGLFFTFYRWIKARQMISREFINKELSTIIILLVLVFSMYQYYKIPFKDLRYIFPLVLPAAYFSLITFDKIKEKFHKLYRVIPVLIVSVTFIITLLMILTSYSYWNTEDRYKDAIDMTEYLGLGNCRIQSNEWPLLNYLGRLAEPIPYSGYFWNAINDGNHIIIFHSLDLPENVRNVTTQPQWTDDKEFLRNYPVLYENSEFMILGRGWSGCNPIRPVDYTYMELIGVEEDPCHVMFKDGPLNKFCNIINLKSV